MADLYDAPIAGQSVGPSGFVEITTHQAQAQGEGVVEDFDTIEFFGEKFRLAERVSIMPMLAFANASKKGLDSDDMEGLAAMYSMIRSVIHRPPLVDEHGQRQVDENGKPLRDESEWNRFEMLAIDEGAEGEDVMAVVNQAMSIMSARPTKPRGDSPASLRQTSASSRDGSSLRAIDPRMAELTPVSQLGAL